jgi:hypothetical protein
MNINQALAKMGTTLCTETVTLMYPAETVSPDLPAQAAQTEPEYVSVELLADVDEIARNARAQALGYQADVDFIVMIMAQTMIDAGLDVTSPTILTRLSKSRFIVRGHLCSSHQTPEATGKLTDKCAFIDFRIRKFKRT